MRFYHCSIRSVDVDKIGEDIYLLKSINFDEFNGIEFESVSTSKYNHVNQVLIYDYWYANLK